MFSSCPGHILHLDFSLTIQIWWSLLTVTLFLAIQSFQDFAQVVTAMRKLVSQFLYKDMDARKLKFPSYMKYNGNIVSGKGPWPQCVGWSSTSQYYSFSWSTTHAVREGDCVWQWWHLKQISYYWICTRFIQSWPYNINIRCKIWYTITVPLVGISHNTYLWLILVLFLNMIILMLGFCILTVLNNEFQTPTYCWCLSTLFN